MQKNSTTPARVNKVKIAFSKKMMTAYGGLSLMASFFKQIRLREAIESAVPVQERSPNSTGVYSKITMYFAMVYAGAERFAHAGYLGNKALLAVLFGVKRMPEAATSLTRFFNKIKSFTYADTLSYSLRLYLVQLIQWEQIVEALEQERLTYIIAVKLFRPLQREIYGLTTWKSVDRGIWIAEFSLCIRGEERRYIAVRQDITRRKKATDENPALQILCPACTDGKQGKRRRIADFRNE